MTLDGYVDRQGYFGRVADFSDLFSLLTTGIVFINQPDFGGKRCAGETIIIVLSPGATDFQGRAWYVKNKYVVGIQSTSPKVLAVIGKPRVVDLIAPAYRKIADHLARVFLNYQAS